MNLTLARALAVAVLAVGTGRDRPSDASVAAYRAAQKSALARVVSKAFAASIDQVKAGAWTSRADLGACRTKLSPPPEKDDGSVYAAWVVDGANDDSIAGWGHLPERVFKSSLDSVGDPGKSPPPESETRTVAATKRLLAMDPTSDDDVLVLYVDAIHRPAQSGESTFTGGDENGRAWVWTSKSRTIVCAGVFSSTTPHEVLATFFLSPSDRTGEVDSSLMLALRQRR